MKSAIEAELEAEVTETLGAAKGKRTETRRGYRSGYYQRSLITRVGTLELLVPQDRVGRFSTELFERYQRWEKALGSALWLALRRPSSVASPISSTDDKPLRRGHRAAAGACGRPDMNFTRYGFQIAA